MGEYVLALAAFSIAGAWMLTNDPELATTMAQGFRAAESPAQRELEPQPSAAEDVKIPT